MVEFVIRGARLSDATELLLYDPGTQVLELSAEADNQLKVKLEIADDCEPGLHAFRLATQTGISNLRYFSVSPLPQAEEVEPNSDFSQPQAVELNTTINGVIKTEDVDYFVVDVKAGQVVTVEIEGLRLGTEFFDPFVAILNQDRFEVARSDDAPLLRQDCVCSYTAEADGRYVIEIRESSFGGNDRCQYRMHIGDFPRPLSIMPAGGQPGETLDATIVDASGESWKELIQLPDHPGEFNYFASRDGQLAPSPNILRVGEFRNVIENESNDEQATAVAADVPVAFNGVLREAGDVDWFRFRANKGQNLQFNVYGRRSLRSPIDSWIEIHKVGGGQLVANDDAGGPDSNLTFNKFPEDGEYLLAIRDQLGEGSPLHTYRVEVAPPARTMSLSISELQRYQSQTIEVPQGGQMAVRLNASRGGVQGDLAISLGNLPAGLELMTPKMAANENFIPMLLKASPDAELDAALCPLSAQTSGDVTSGDVTSGNGAGIIGKLDQRTMLVRGQNNRDMWGHDTDRVAIAVTKKLPFSIEVVQPEVPLVRGGSTHYQVIAHRDEGFKERIYLRVLYNPNGCSANDSVRIEPDQTEALIPVTANDKATIGVFPITILARAKSVNANVWLASEFINLEVADSFFDFKFGKTVAELGESTFVVVGVETKKPPEGDVEFEIVGLPAGVVCDQPKLKLTSDLKQLAFPVQVAADAGDGQFKTIYVKATITRPGGQIVQTGGLGEIQLAAPIAATSLADKQSSASSTESQEVKPVNRLDQLRQAKKSAGGTLP